MYVLVVALAFMAPKPSAKKVTGSIEVRSTTEGAKILLDDKAAGVAPATLKGVAVGTHRVKLKKLGYGGAEQSVNVEPDKRVALQIDLRASAGVLVAKSSPKGAQLIVEDKVLGNTPYEGEIPVGRCRVEIKKEGHLTFLEVLQISAGETYKIEATLLKGSDPPSDLPLTALSPKKRRGDTTGYDIPLEAPPALSPITKRSELLAEGAAVGVQVQANEPLHKKWWLWTIVGAVVAGGVITAVVLGTQANSGEVPQRDFQATLELAR